jgi:hypothetical protein
MKFLPCVLLLLASSLAAAEPRSREKGLFEFRDGDRVVFLGSAFIERLQNTGYLETMLTAAMPSKNITFRNLGWSGDTVWGDARALFGSRADGYKRLLSDVALCKPTVLIVCYGENEAYNGEAGLEEFRRGLSTLLDSLEATGARIVLFGPRQHERMPPPLPDPAKYNADLRKYNDVTSQVAKEREHTFIDLYASVPRPRIRDASRTRTRWVSTERLTDNGASLSIHGDYEVSQIVAASFGLSFERQIAINLSTLDYSTTNVVMHQIREDEKGIRIDIEDRSLAWAVSEDMAVGPEIRSFLRFTDLTGMLCTINSNDVLIGEFSGPIVEGLEVMINPTFKGNDTIVGKQIAKLNQAINEKNTLFFHRYRPQNETYLFLFRKHEQGNNAVEIPQFDPLIAELEKKIAVLKQPVKQKYELIKVK